MGYKKLSLLRELVTAYRDQNDLGGGNFIPPKVYKNKNMLDTSHTTEDFGEKISFPTTREGVWAI